VITGNTLAAAFGAARAQHRAALIAYIVAGDPDAATTDAVIDALTEAGVDLIELGVPYGDPLADGPTIAAAALRALQGGTRMADAIGIVARARSRGAAPIMLFTYVNPVDRYGADRFAHDAAAAGAVGALVPDVPLEELASFAPPLRAAGLAVPLMIAPTTPHGRAERIAAAADGFLYLVSRLGVTGTSRAPDTAWIDASLARLRSITKLPIAVGFGISTPAHAAAVGRLADGVIVGSAVIDAYAGRRGAEAARMAGAYASSLRSALPSPA